MKIFWIFLLLPLSALAETQEVSLQLPSDFVHQICPAPVSGSPSFVWEGVTDKRTSPEIAEQEAKNKDPVVVTSKPPLAERMDQALRLLFPACGVKVLATADDSAPRVSLEITDFYVGVKKKLVTAKGEGHSHFILYSRKSGGDFKVSEVGFEIENKKGRKRDLKATISLSEELLLESLRTIVTHLAL